MTTSKRQSAIEALEADPYGSRELEAARLTHQAVGGLNAAVETAGISMTILADRLGVGVSRVSQVLSGEGNLRLSTLARFLRAAGYRARLVIEPVDESVPPIPERPKRVRSGNRSVPSYLHVYKAPVIDEIGTSSAFIVATSVSPSHDVLLGTPRHMRTVERAAGIRTSFGVEFAFEPAREQRKVPENV